MNCKLSFISLLILAMGINSCNNHKKSAPINNISANIEIKKTEISLNVDEKEQIKLKEDNAESDNLKWSSLNNDIASVTSIGELNALKEGSTFIKVDNGSSSDSIKVEVKEIDTEGPINLTCLGKPLDEIDIYSKNIELVAPYRVMQSFDLDTKGNIFYSQIGKASGFEQGETKAHEVYIIKKKPNSSNSKKDYMTLKFSGHGANIALEEGEENDYVWVSTNATKYDSGEYWDARSVSRIKYESGKVHEGYGGENYFLNNGLYRIQAAIDVNSNLITINATKDGTRYFYTYKLSEIKELPTTDFTFSVRNGGEQIGDKEEQITRIVKGHDLSKLEPLGSFFIPPGDNKVVDVNSCHFQGYDIDSNQHIYFHEGDGHDITDTIGRPSEAYVTVYDIKGKIVGERTRVSAITHAGELIGAGITNKSGYMEGEGIKVRGNQIYLGYASHQGSNNYRRANILKINSYRN